MHSGFRRLTPLFAIAACLAAPPLTAAAEPIVTDRPAFVSSASTVDEHSFQFETSVQRVEDGDGASLFRSWSTPTLVRFGLEHRMEMRMQSAAFSHVRFASDVTNGASDMNLGIKGVVPWTFDPELTMAWIADALLPTGSQAIKGNGVRPTFRMAADWRLPQNSSIGVMPGLRADRDVTGNWYPTGMLGVNVAHAWNPRVSSYAEMSDREIRRDSRGGNNLVWDVGSAWHLRPDTQLDASVGFGAKQNDTDRIWSVGLSRRFTPRAPGAIGSRGTTPDAPSASTQDEK